MNRWVIKTCSYLLLCSFPLEIAAMGTRQPAPEKKYLNPDDNLANRGKERREERRERREERRENRREVKRERRDDWRERQENRREQMEERREEMRERSERDERRRKEMEERREQMEERREEREEREREERRRRERREERAEEEREEAQERERRERREEREEEQEERERRERRERREERRDERREERREDRREGRRERRGNYREWRRENRSGWRDRRRSHRRYVRRNFWERRRYWRDRWRGYYHPNRWYYYDERDWWIWNTFGFLTDFLILSFSDREPVYYLYDGYDVLYIENNYVYWQGEPQGTVSQYAEEAKEIADKVPNVDPANVEMRSLGVWSLEQDVDKDEEPIMYLQLAISKEGIIAGMYQNSEQETVSAIEGTVDPLTQRVAWKFVGQEYPVMETALGDLTSEEGMAKLLVFGENGQVEEWTMVRLDKDQNN